MNHSGITAARSASVTFCWMTVMSEVAVMKYTNPSTKPIGYAGPTDRTSANAARLRANAPYPHGTRRRLSTSASHEPTASAPKRAPDPHTTYRNLYSAPVGSRPKLSRATDGNSPTNGSDTSEKSVIDASTRASTRRWRAMLMPVVSRRQPCSGWLPLADGNPWRSTGTTMMR
jgi:hypothetical protein